MTDLSIKRISSTCLGNFFEHYDSALFGFLSLFLAPVIFPKEDPITALIYIYAMIPLGMLARPVGALFFGLIGDAYGRRQALFLSLGGMSIVSLCMALSPTYYEIGVIAPLFFVVCRFLQNFLAAGETMGGAIYLLENVNTSKHDFISSLYNSSTVGGIILASFGVTILSQYNMLDTGWRLLYLFGCITGLFGFIIRKQLPFDNDFIKKETSFNNFLEVLWKERAALLLIAICSGFAYANYSMALVLINGFVPLVSKSTTNTEMMSLNTSLLIIDFLALPFFGYLASKFSREKFMLTAAMIITVFAIPLFVLIPEVSFLGLVVIRIFLVLAGVAFSAPFHAWAQQLVVPGHRYIVISFGYAIGSQVLGGPTAAISLWIYKNTQILSSIGWYWVFLALLSTVSLRMSIQRKSKIIMQEI